MDAVYPCESVSISKCNTCIRDKYTQPNQDYRVGTAAFSLLPRHYGQRESINSASISRFFQGPQFSGADNKYHKELPQHCFTLFCALVYQLRPTFRRPKSIYMYICYVMCVKERFKNISLKLKHKEIFACAGNDSNHSDNCNRSMRR